MVEVTTKKSEGSQVAALFFSGVGRYVLTLVLLLGSTSAYAQTNTHDSIYASMHGRISLAGGLDSRNSFINNRKAHIWGVKVAAEFGELIQLGIGYNRLDDDLTKRIYYVNSAFENDSATGKLKMDYWSWYARYVFYRKGRWKFSVIPFQLGIGRSRYMYEVNNQKLYAQKKSILVYETGFSVSFKVCRWLGVGGDIGVRYMVKPNPYIPEKFNGPQYAFYAVIYWTEILRAVAPENRFVKML
jgi:hypothetical protein